MTLRLSFVMSFALATAAACSRSHGTHASTELRPLTVEQVAAKVAKNDGKTYIFDDNAHDRYVEGHVPGAKSLEDRAPTAADLPAEKSAMLVFYCAGEQCHACHTAALAAEKLGYTNVYIMPAGIAGWEKAGQPEQKG